MSVNRDTVVAMVLLLICGGLMFASFEIREPDYGQLSPATWPRFIIAIMAVLSTMLLVQSIRKGADTRMAPDAVPSKHDDEDEERKPGLKGFILYWRNVLWVFSLFLSYLLVMPYIGMMLGGMLFCFLLLTVLGGVKNTPIHIAIALIAVGGMWALFTFGLGVILPTGTLTGF